VVLDAEGGGGGCCCCCDCGCCWAEAGGGGQRAGLLCSSAIVSLLSLQGNQNDPQARWLVGGDVHVRLAMMCSNGSRRNCAGDDVSGHPALATHGVSVHRTAQTRDEEGTPDPRCC